MKIGIDARMYSSEFGIGVYIAQFLEYLFKIDARSEYVLFFNEPAYSEFNLPRPRVKKILANIPHYSWAEQTSFLRLLYEHKLDIMHFTHFNAPLFYRKPSVVTIHDLTIKFFPGKKHTSFFKRLAYRLALRSIVKRSKKIISVSEHTKQDLLKLYRLDPEKIRVIHLGVNPRFHVIHDEHLRDEFRKTAGLENPYLLYTGNWRDHKNLVNLIGAFSILKKRHHISHLLVITGKEDPWYPEVKQAVCDANLEGQVRFAGIIPLEDLPLLYNCADLYVLPSLYEGFGLPALEAFACGTAVVASKTSSIPEVCGDAALYFDPRDPENMAEIIRAALNNQQKKGELIEKGFERVKLFSWEKTAKLTLELYREAVRL